MAEIHLAAANRLFKQTEPDLTIPLSFMKARFSMDGTPETTKTGNAAVSIPPHLRTLKGAYDVPKRVYDNTSEKKPDSEKIELGLRKTEKLIADFRNLLNEAEE